MTEAQSSRERAPWLAPAEWAATLVLTLFVLGLALFATSSGADAVSFDHQTAQEGVEPYRVHIDVNRDPWQRMTLVPGIGERTAKRIVAYREEHGPFGSLDELKEVRGIGQGRLDAWRPHLREIESEEP